MRARKSLTPTIQNPRPEPSIGAQGPQGRQGSQGERGPTGAGDPGPPGLQGSPGEHGRTGDVGAQGAEGHVGAQGAQGIRGAPGSDGAEGPPGPPGQTGQQGMQGHTGAQGDVGAQGDQGERGAQGGPGAFKKWPLWMWSCIGVDGTRDRKFLHSFGGGAPSKNERVSFWGPAAAPGVVTDVAVFLSVAMSNDDIRVTLRQNTSDVLTVPITAGQTQTIVSKDLVFDTGAVFSVAIEVGDEVNIEAGLRVVVYGHP